MSVGIKVAQRGTDVGRAADYQLNLSSEWPLLKVAKVGKIGFSSITATYPGLVLNEHGLGYYAPFIFFDGGSDIGFSSPFLRKSSPGEAMPVFDSDIVQLDPTKLYYVDGGNNPSFTGYYIIFDWDLSKPFKAASFSAVSQPSTKNSEEGLQITKGEPISKARDRDFSIDTRTRPMTVHMSGPIGVDVSGNIIIDHNLGYLPIFMLWRKNETGRMSLVNAKVTGDPSRITIKGAQSALSGDYFFMVLKDPLVVG